VAAAAAATECGCEMLSRLSTEADGEYKIYRSLYAESVNYQNRGLCKFVRGTPSGPNSDFYFSK
jgi:hypothetical protein